MADIPKIRFKGFTEPWEQRKVSETAEIVAGGTPSTSVSEYWEPKEVPWLSSGEVHKKYVTYTDDMISKLGLSNSSAKMIKENSILIALAGQGKTRGTVAINRISLSTNQSIAAMTFNDDIIPEFVFSNLENRYDEIRAMSSGDGSRGGLNKQLVGNIVIPYTIIEEQRKIGAYFENLDNLITLHQRKCDDTKELKKYMLQKMFPKNGEKFPEIRFKGFTEAWEQRKLGDLVISHNAGIYISKEDYGTGTNVIGVGNIYDNDIFDGEIYRLGPVNDEKFLLEENDLIYGESSLVPEGIARTVCVGKNGVGSAFAWHTRRVKLDQRVINSHFATLELNYNIDVRKYLISVSTQTALTGMTTEGYFGATLSLPTVEEQAHISSLFKQLDHLITLHQRKCDTLKELKKYMLQNMFPKKG